MHLAPYAFKTAHPGPLLLTPVLSSPFSLPPPGPGTVVAEPAPPCTRGVLAASATRRERLRRELRARGARAEEGLKGGLMGPEIIREGTTPASRRHECFGRGGAIREGLRRRAKGCTRVGWGGRKGAERTAGWTAGTEQHNNPALVVRGGGRRTRRIPNDGGARAYHRHILLRWPAKADFFFKKTT